MTEPQGAVRAWGAPHLVRRPAPRFASLRPAQLKLEHVEISLHVSALDVPVNGIMPTSRANRKTIWLTVRPVRGDPDHLRMAKYLTVGGQQGKPLIDDLACRAESPDSPIPAVAAKQRFCTKRGRTRAP